MVKTILNSFQKQTLYIFGKSFLHDKFYLSGGTALAEFYLQHRLSEDLDFFTQGELDLEELKKFIHLVARKNEISTVEFQHGFGLYTFFLLDKNKKFKHKIDFGQYPFEPIEELKKIGGILVESMYDIAVNKAHTIAFHPRLRDFIDLYCILQKKKNWTFSEVLNKSFAKFEMKVDALQLGENLLQVETLKDMPVMVKKIDMDKMKIFFLSEAKKLDKKIFHLR